MSCQQFDLVDESNNDEVIEGIQQLLSSSDDDSDGKWGGSRPGRRPNIDRNREAGAVRLISDYFSSDAVYPDEMFELRFRLSRDIVLEIKDRLEVYDVYFTQRRDCTGKLGLTALQKVTAALRMLAYGSGADSLDEVLRMGESTVLESLSHFCDVITDIYKEEYMRSPTVNDVERILKRSEALGFPGMLGSIDCCKWEWKNCPAALHGQFQGKEGVPTVTLEAIANDELWIWHACVGLPGCLNDINVLDASPLFNKIANGKYPPPVEYYTAGKKRRIPYWLADRIYPKWPMFVQTIQEPGSRQEKLMGTSQEGRRKDVERAFGVLQAKWHIIARLCRFWYRDMMKKVIECCIILHNRMVERRREPLSTSSATSAIIVGDQALPAYALKRAGVATIPPPGSIAALTSMNNLLGDTNEYFRRRELVIEHLWNRKGQSRDLDVKMLY